ncbi:MAG TPA: hypothetical protein VL053_14875 [Arachidicoccus sp.]|nr:hypothetical protein [Arachidicoccus sp.]
MEIQKLFKTFAAKDWIAGRLVFKKENKNKLSKNENLPLMAFIISTKFDTLWPGL